ncbi:MAG: CHAP domain-containing protein [Candidatus Cyclobacteriaceae bacterium M2_1C_046]
MAKANTLYVYLFCFLVCSSAAGQNPIGFFDINAQQDANTAELNNQKRQRLQQVYLNEVGIREQGGANRGEQVEQYLASVGFGPGHAWCAAFVSWCYQQVGVAHPKSAWVPSYATKQNLIYQRGKFIKQLPQAGDVFLIRYERLMRPAHIGFVDEWQNTWVITVEGNTNDDGSREGDGVYRKRRVQRQIWAVGNFIDF